MAAATAHGDADFLSDEEPGFYSRHSFDVVRGVASPERPALPMVPLELLRRQFPACVELALGTVPASASVPASPGGSCYQCPVHIGLPWIFASDAWQRAPYALLVEGLTLVRTSCSNPAASCVLFMDSMLLRSEVRTTASDTPRAADAPPSTPSAGHTVTCSLPFGSAGSDHAPLKELFLGPYPSAMQPAELQREFRFRRYASSASLLAEVQFDEQSGLYVPPAPPRDEPLLVIILRRNWGTMRPAPSAATPSAASPAAAAIRREDFASICKMLDEQYFGGTRPRARLYASALTGHVLSDTPCRLQLHFNVRVLGLSQKHVPGPGFELVAPPPPAAQAAKGAQ